jgi:Phosphoglucomutase/phosphomannomutase, C-terminal domain
LVRASNTSPALTVRCEARTPEKLEQIKAEMHDLLARHPSVDLGEWPAEVVPPESGRRAGSAAQDVELPR